MKKLLISVDTFHHHHLLHRNLNALMFILNAVTKGLALKFVEEKMEKKLKYQLNVKEQFYLFGCHLELKSIWVACKVVE